MKVDYSNNYTKPWIVGSSPTPPTILWGDGLTGKGNGQKVST